MSTKSRKSSENANKQSTSNPSTSSSSSSSKSAKSSDEPLWKSIMKLEPALVLHMTAGLMVMMTIQDFMLEKACRVNLQYSNEVCDALKAKQADGFDEEEKAVQKLISTATVYRTGIENAFPIFLVFLIGAWSDKYGRKFPMLLVIFAFFVQNIALMICVWLNELTGVWTVAIVSSLIASLSGNNACFFVAVFSYVSDNTSVERRTMRQGITHSSIFLGLVLGLASGGIMAKSGLPYEKIFMVGVLLEATAFIYFFFSMKNQPQPGAMKGKSFTKIFLELFDFNHIKESVKCVFKKREGNTRTKLSLLLLAHSCAFMPMIGEMGVCYLFCRLQFNWDGAAFGTFMTYKTLLGLLSNFVSMGILAQYFKLTDFANGIVASSSNLISFLIFATAVSPTMMFIAPLASLFAGAAMIVPRGLISKIIPTGELGKVNSFIGSLESIIPLVASSIYTKVYTSTLDVLPGAFYLVSGALMVPPIFIYLWFMQQDTNNKKKKKN